MTKQTKHLLVLTACSDSAIAEKIAQDLVEHHVAACVNIIPNITSYFRWNGKLDSACELLLLIKTTATRFDELEQRIKSLHPYELPEIIALPIEYGLMDYLRWIEHSTDLKTNKAE